MASTSRLKPHCAIVSDSPVEAQLVKSLLEGDFEDIATHVGTPEAAQTLRMDRPVVLLLAFRELAKAEHYHLSIYRHGNLHRLQPHRTVLLCTKEDASSAYKLCHAGLFDDYVVFWPITHDPMRLLMAVHRSASELEHPTAKGSTSAQFATQAHRVADLEGLLAAQLERGQEHIASTGRAVEQAESAIAIALRSRPAGEAFPACETLIAPHWRSINDSLLPLSVWAENVLQAVAPQLESARELATMARSLRQSILIVDDDEFQRRIVGRLLEDEGYEPAYAASGAEALSILQKGLPALMLLDFQMPDIDGVEVIRKVKADPLLAPVPVIMVTGNGGQSLVRKSRELGAADFIVKPFSRNTLMSKIARVMDQGPALNPH